MQWVLNQKNDSGKCGDLIKQIGGFLSWFLIALASDMMNPTQYIVFRNMLIININGIIERSDCCSIKCFDFSIIPDTLLPPKEKRSIPGQPKMFNLFSRV